MAEPRERLMVSKPSHEYVKKYRDKLNKNVKAGQPTFLLVDAADRIFKEHKEAQKCRT